MTKPIIICVCKSGGRYNAEWVRKLKVAVEAHMTIAYDFLCLSDIEVPCDRIEITEPWGGWWSKIALFNLQILKERPVLYLDLDTVVTGDLTPLIRTTPGFTMVEDFYYPKLGNSCALSWIGDYGLIYDSFMEDPHGVMAKWDAMPGAEIGDQGFEHATLRGRFDRFDPKMVVSYKKDGRRGIPKNARVVAFHGNPKPDDPKAGWAHVLWSNL